VAEDGSFAPDDGSWALIVPGHAVPARDSTLYVPTRSGGDLIHVHRHANPDTLLSGVVVTQRDGLPVAGLDLHLVASLGRPRYGVHGPDLDLLASVPAGRLRAVARTDDRGRFEVRGLAARETCEVLAASGLWYTDSSRTVTVGEPARVTVVPAFRVSGRVVADESGDSFPAFDVRLAWSGSALGFDGADGAWSATLPSPGDAPFEVVVAVAAAGREPAKGSVWIDAARPDAAVDLRLRRLLPAAKAGVAFEIEGGPDGFAAQPFDLELREAPGDGALLQRLPTERVEPTRVRATVPAGKWHLRLRAVDVSSGPPDWRGILDLVEGHETEVRWTVPR
jgi:hypothetical protein